METSHFHRLTSTEQAHPYRVVDEFFNCYELPEVRESLRNWYAAALSSQSTTLEEPRSHSDLFFLYEQLERLAEATFLLHQRHQSKKAS